MVKATLPKIYVDFQNADANGRLRLNCVGTTRDLTRQRVDVREGKTLLLYSEDVDQDGRAGELHVAGRIERSAEEQCWVAVIDWDAIRRVTDGFAPTLGAGEAPGLELAGNLTSVRPGSVEKAS